MFGNSNLKYGFDITLTACNPNRNCRTRVLVGPGQGLLAAFLFNYTNSKRYHICWHIIATVNCGKISSAKSLIMSALEYFLNME